MLKSENLVVSQQDKDYLFSTDRTVELAERLALKYEQLTPAERRSYSIEELAPIVKMFARTARLLNPKFDPSNVISNAPDAALLRDKLDFLQDYLKRADEKAFQMINKKSLTIENVVQYVLTIETARLVLTETNPRLIAMRGWHTRGVVKVLQSLDDLLPSALNDIVKHIEGGGIWVPTFAVTDIDFFTNRFPRIRPIALSTRAIAPYDGNDWADAYLSTLHDISFHQMFTQPSEAKFQAIERIEKKFYANVERRKPALREWSEIFFFYVVHESHNWAKAFETQFDSGKLNPVRLGGYSALHFSGTFSANAIQSFLAKDAKMLRAFNKPLYLKTFPGGLHSTEEASAAILKLMSLLKETIEEEPNAASLN